MRYLGVILACLLCFSSLELSAQFYPKSEKEANLEAMASASGIYQRHSSIWSAGNKLSKEELSAMEGFDIKLYSKGRTKAGVGTALISIGAVPCLIGTLGFIGSIQEGIEYSRDKKKGLEPMPGSGVQQVFMVLGYGTGALFEAFGFSLRCSGRADIRHAAVGYNGQKRLQYSLGPSTSGLGFALYF